MMVEENEGELNVLMQAWARGMVVYFWLAGCYYRKDLSLPKNTRFKGLSAHYYHDSCIIDSRICSLFYVNATSSPTLTATDANMTSC